MNILFMCVANSARSQIAEGLAKKIFPQAVIQSAGSEPKTVNPYAIKVMQEIGIDLSLHYSKSLEQLPTEFIDRIDYIITLCAEEVCPILVAKNATRLHWPIPDPASHEPLAEEEMIKRFCAARSVIQEKLNSFKRELGDE